VLDEAGLGPQRGQVNLVYISAEGLACMWANFGTSSVQNLYMKQVVKLCVAAKSTMFLCTLPSLDLKASVSKRT